MTPRLESLVRTIEALGDATGAAESVDKARLALLLTEAMMEGMTTPLVGLLAHPNVDARRIALHAVRRAGFRRHAAIVAAVVARLHDPIGAVRRDAASALAADFVRTPEALAALHELAEGTSPAETFDVDDDHQQARVAAAKALLALRVDER